MAEKMYHKIREEKDGTLVIEGYAYGEEWVSMALYMDDLCFKTPEEAVAWWEKNYGGAYA